ncbi:hypothetical protein [Chitinophaga ginsengisoli]|uniref:Uncharacterized protein n=1 Tax=Chitinophaga ginsengisoli TaxID=363837 RepID=A0A2P8FMT0_9BACT|nr:hypothetical protein [Chitinophaga ginsengisoli]PSL23026.1 hypothetical protein CLV42_11946 [Chitinophaga ginsengisoli]
MDTLKLSDLIGQEIAGVRFCYSPENDDEYSVQSFYTYIKLNNNSIIDIPNDDDDEYVRLTPESQAYFQERFDNGKAISDEGAKCLIGQTIVDFLFCYENDERDYERAAYIRLSNGYYFTERNFAPMGIYVGIRVFDEQQFLEEKDRLADKSGITIRSFLENRTVG